MHPRQASTLPLSLKLGFKVGNRASLVDPRGFFKALSTCSFLFTYSVSFIYRRSRREVSLWASLGAYPIPCPGWVSELSGAAKRNPGRKGNSLDSSFLLLPGSRAAAGSPPRPGHLACSASRSHLIRFRSCFPAQFRCSPVYGGWRARPCFPTHTKRLATGDRLTDRQSDVPAKLRGGVREGVEPPGRGGPRSGAQPPALFSAWVFGGDTKSSPLSVRRLAAGVRSWTRRAAGQVEGAA